MANRNIRRERAFIPSADYLIVEGTSPGRMAGKSWAGGKTPGGRFCNVFKFRDGRISSLHIYLILTIQARMRRGFDGARTVNVRLITIRETIFRA